MKKSNNKRTKRLRLKYKKTKRNVKRRTLRKTRHRQSGGVYPTIIPSTLPVARVMFNTIFSSVRNQANIVGKKLKEEIKEAAVTTFKENNGNEFTFGHHGPNELKKYTIFFNELGKTIRNKLQKKTFKETMENIKDICLLDEPAKQTFTSENIARQIYYKNPTASAVAPSQKKSLYPIINMYNYENINLDQVKQLQKEIGIDDKTSAEKITEKINEFVDDLKIKASKCNMPSKSMHSATTTGSKKSATTSGSNRSVKGSKTLTPSQ